MFIFLFFIHGFPYQPNLPVLWLLKTVKDYLGMWNETVVAVWSLLDESDYSIPIL